MQRVEQLVVARRHVQTRQHAAAQVVRPVAAALLLDQQQRQVGRLRTQLLEQARGAALAVDPAEQDAGQAGDILAGQPFGPVGAGAAATGLAEEVEDHRQVMAALLVVIYQQD
ncbi:hypothetical protein D3C81_1720840 [compost metagenome]